MNFKLILLSSLSFIGRPSAFCTANAAADDIKDLATQFDALKKENETSKATIADLQKQIDAHAQVAPQQVEVPTAVSMLCKGAGVDISDVRWRMQAGLDSETAVAAALAQKEHDDAEAEAAVKKKGKGK